MRVKIAKSDNGKNLLKLIENVDHDICLQLALRVGDVSNDVNC